MTADFTLCDGVSACVAKDGARTCIVPSGVRVGGYIRVSSVGARDRDTFLSPTLQRDRIAQWCQAHGHDLVDVREDLDVSGGKRDRENLTDLVERVERGQLEGIVVAKLDRFARNIGHAVAMIERIDAAGGQFVSVADGFDTRTPYGRLALNILLSVAQFELERYREGWRESRAKMIEQGRHYGPTAPLGYQRAPGGRLVVDPAVAPLVREVFDRAAAGVSVSDIGRWLAGEGVRTGRGGVPGARFVRELVANPVYLGQARAGDFVNDEAHEPLVTREVWERARSMRAPRPARGDLAVLSGLVRCDGCRYVMNAAQTPYAGGKKRAYRCRGRHASGECPAPAMAVEELLWPIVEAEFFTRVGNLQARAAGDTEAVARLQDRRAEAVHALTVYRDDPGIIGALGASAYADGLRVRQAAVDAVDREIAGELARRPQGLPDVALLRMMWPDVEKETRRRMIAAVFDAVVVSKPRVHRSHSEPLKGRVRFIAAGGLPVDVPRPGRRPVAVRGFGGLGDPPGAGVPVG